MRLWSGHTGKQFYAESCADGRWIAYSPFFAVERGSSVDDSANAAEALDALLDQLVADGWEVMQRPPDVMLRRPARP